MSSLSSPNWDNIITIENWSEGRSVYLYIDRHVAKKFVWLYLGKILADETEH
ncbi:MAG TPA: hypothetical protein V6D10_20985 [Trichocoleus sp.]